MALIDNVRLALRIEGTSLDSEIQSNIDVCLLDLQRVGITAIASTDPFASKLCELYTKGQMKFDGETEKYNLAYEKLRDGLSMCGDYYVRQEN